MIQTALNSLKVTGKAVLDSIEASKDDDKEQGARKQVDDWSKVGVSILTKHLTSSEKIKLLSQIVQEVRAAA